MVKFYPHNHTYESVDEFEKIQWTSVTALVGMFVEKFDADAQALKSSLNKKSKWYGIHPTKIKEFWRNENKRAVDLGNWYHKHEENKLLGCDSVVRYGKSLNVIRPTFEKEIKIAPDQTLKDGIYPEHFMYLKTKGVCGQSDEVIVSNGFVNIDDHKSNKDLKKAPYKNWEGITKKLLSPLSHLPDCKLAEYSLQLSTYLYIILKHNPNLKPGTLTLNHVLFEEESRDQFDYPILKLDEKGDPIMKSVEKIEVPFLKKEVELMFYYKNAV